MDKTQIIPPSTGKGSRLPDAAARPNPLLSPCGPCKIRHLAICSALSHDELQYLAAIVSTVTLDADQPLFDEGQPAQHVYIVTSGAMRLYKLLPDGRRQVTGFLFVSDFLGLANGENYAYGAEAVADAELCRFRRGELDALVDRFPRMEKQLFGLASNELAVAQEQMLVLGRKSARERIASFLLMLQERASRRQPKSDLVAVPMNRADVGDYLGLSTETVSRTFTELKLANVIALDKPTKVRILNQQLIQDIAAGIRAPAPGASGQYAPITRH